MHAEPVTVTVVLLSGSCGFQVNTGTIVGVGIAETDVRVALCDRELG